MIDNIDRADADNVLFLFKLIGTVFDLPNIVYVLAYDPKRIEEIFSDTNKINPQYTEKIWREGQENEKGHPGVLQQCCLWR